MIAWRTTPTADVTDDPVRRGGKSDLGLFEDVVRQIREGGN